MPPVTFELEHLESEDGRLVVTGRWHGVRGLRFVRPTLIVDGQAALATLEDKPWAPDLDPWRAAFPWDGGPVDAADAVLSVAPSVTVPLTDHGDVPPPPTRLDAIRDELEAERLRADRLADEVSYLRRELREAKREAEARAAEPAPEPPAPDPPPAPKEPGPDLGPALAAAERERDALRDRLAAAERERDAALAEQERLSAVAAEHDTLRAQLTAAHTELAELRPVVPAPPPHPDDEAPSGVRVGHPDAPRRRTSSEELGLSSVEQLLGRVLGVAAVVCLVLLAITFLATLF